MEEAGAGGRAGIFEERALEGTFEERALEGALEEQSWLGPAETKEIWTWDLWPSLGETRE